MKIALINGSPKRKGSSSSALLEDLKKLLPDEHQIKQFHFNKPLLTEDEITELQDCSAWVFAFPLYVDSIPSHLLSCLCQLEQADFNRNGIHIYTFVNCGFYEGKQNTYALSIMENWCYKAGLNWGMGIGFGGGGALSSMKNAPLEKGPKRNLGISLTVFVEAISRQDQKDNIITSIAFPRFLYKLIIELEWRKSIKANGGKVKDLKKRY